jgi:hypothetical protein
MGASFYPLKTGHLTLRKSEHAKLPITERQWSGVSEGPGETVKNIASFNDR